ncbi:MAG TPA: pitrilysin family protein [Tepidisphaeraceae bacterium]|nr:pitrilysin family protein [Tepidisphaeraceae bacterium]
MNAEKPMRIVFSVFLAVCLCLATAFAQTTKPAVESPAGPEEPAPFSQVRYWEVHQKDEIVCVLDNGMTVIAKRIVSPVLAVRMRVGTGGVYEGHFLGGGLSHLLEHLVAGGSSQRRTESQNKELLQEIGNNSDAYTTEDHTDFFVDTTPEHLDQAVDLVSGWVLGALITPDEYHREYQVVQRELEMGKGEPDRQFWYLSQMNRYRVSPARVPVIGYQPVIQGLTRDDVYNYYKLAYVPENMIFSLAGDVDPYKMLEAVQKYVANAKPGRVFQHNIPQEPPVTAPRSIMASFPKLGQAELGLAFPSVKLNAPDMYALDLLATVLGDGDSSVLVEQLRDKQQLVSSITAEDDTPSYVSGTFNIVMKLDSPKIPQAREAVEKIIEQIKENGVPSDALARGKTQIRVDHARAEQTAEAVAQTLADDLAETGDVHSSDRYVDRIAAVTSEDIKRVARKYLRDNRLISTALLPQNYVAAAGLPKAEDLIRPGGLEKTAVAQGEESSVQRLVLDDGTVVLLKRIPTSPIVSIQMFALGGLTAEDPKTNGLGNLTMELAMRGTKTRSAEQIAQTLDSMGTEMDTAANHNTWSWRASCLKDDLAPTLEVFTDIFKNADFPADQLTTMKERIFAAIASEDSNWSTEAIDFFNKKFFGPLGSPYQYTTLGTDSNQQSFDRQQVVDWYHDHVQKAPRVLAIYGDIDLNQAERLLRNDFAGAPHVEQKTSEEAKGQAATPADTNPHPSPSIDVARVQVLPTQKALAAIVIGFDSNAVVGDPKNSVLAVGQTMCAGYTYPTGYLFETLRGRGLVYVVQAWNAPGRSAEFPGTFEALAGCQPANVNQVTESMLENIARLQGTDEDMQVSWFQRAKQLIVTADAMENETPEAQGERAALDEIYGLGYRYHEHFADRIDNVTLDEIRQIARQRLSQCVVTICTPQPKSVDVKAGIRTYTSFPAVELTPRGVQHGAVR